MTDFQPLALQPLCGYVLDVIGLKRGYVLLVVAWSLISIGTTGTRCSHYFADEMESFSLNH